MNFRKFFLIISSVITVFLCITGILLVVYINNHDGTKTASNSILDNIASDIKGPKNPMNFLVFGTDKVADQTDTIMLVNYNPQDGSINIMSIPRDTKINVKGSSIPKINSAYAINGAEYLVNIVKSELEIDVNYYVAVDISLFREIIDLLDGVDYNVPCDMDYDDPIQNLHIHLKKGQQHFDGAKAEQFMRFRQPNVYTKEILQYYDGSDLKRIKAQQNFLKEVIRQKAKPQYIAKASDIIDMVFEKIETNLTPNDIFKLLPTADKISVDKVSTFTLPGEISETGGWYYVINKEEAKKITDEYFQTTAQSYSQQ